jgi:hypothetical protein
MITWRLRISVALFLTLFISPVQAQSLLVRGGTLIDGTGRGVIANAEILIQDGVIAGIGSGTSADTPAGMQVVDARGKFIIPGLIDSHIHYRDSNAELFLAHGITTVNDLGNPYLWQSALKKGLNSGQMFGPRYFFCGELDAAAPEIEQQRGIDRRDFALIRKPEDVAPVVKRLKDSGVDCIKLDETIPGEMFAAIAGSAHELGITVISHSMNVSDSVKWGIDGVEHMVGIAVATAISPQARRAVERLHLEAGHKNSALYQWMEPAQFDRVIHDLVQRNVFINPTLAFEWKALHDRAQQHEREDARLFNIPALSYFLVDDRLMILGQYHWADSRSAEEIRQFKDGYRKVQEFLKRFVQAGGKIYAGTDSSAATTPGLSLHHEMELLVDAGLTPIQAIQSATLHGAEILRLNSRLGTIEKGKLADLVVLDANPLENISNTKKISRVIKAGHVVDTRYHADYEIPIKRPGTESKHLYNPRPMIRDVLPPVAIQGDPVDVRVLGRGFTPSSVIRYDGRVVETRFVNSSELRAVLSATQTARVGVYLMSVETPKPGGGVAEPVEFLVTFK